MNRVLMFWIATLLVFAGGMLVWTVMRTSPGAGAVSVVDEDAQVVSYPTLTEFEFLDQTGKRLNSHELDGEVWAGSFFFAACPSTCYNQNIKLQQLHAKYAEKGLHLVSITCDPGNDTPAALASYAARFNADPKFWKFLTPADADSEYIRRVANDFFGVAVGPATHTDRVVLFDRRGNKLGAYSVLKPEQYRNLDKAIEKTLAVTQPEATDESAQSEKPPTTDRTVTASQ
jgi:cytochrome oxidase Cu insertion factor (SCO1/SenC/PrrC family)